MAWNWGSAGKGALGGAASGALAGISGGLVGSGIGSLLGATAGFFGGGFSGAEANSPMAGSNQGEFEKWLVGTPEGQQLISRFSPEQQAELSQLLQSGRANMQNPLAGFEPIRQNALNTFHQEIVPSLAHRFSVSGDNALSSGVLHSQLSGAGANLVSQLAAQETAYGQQNKQFGLEQQRLGLSPQYGSGGLQQMQGQPGIAPRVFDLAFKAFQDYQTNKGKTAATAQATPQTAQGVPASPGAGIANFAGAKQAISPQFTVPALHQFR